MKKFTLTGSVVGALIGLLISVWFASQNYCTGAYLDHIAPDGTPVTGSICQSVGTFVTLQQNLWPTLVTIGVFLVIGLLIGWIIGKVALRHKTV